MASGCSELDGEQRKAPATSESLSGPPSSIWARSRRARLEAGADEPRLRLCRGNPAQRQPLVAAADALPVKRKEH